MKQKKRLSSGKWLVLFLVTALLLAMAVPVFNILTDPFGAFGDPLLQWWSYDMTRNPRLSKMTYLEQNHDKYDSYIIGSSGSSAIPVEGLNRHLDASFYNCFFYGTETQTFEEMAVYILNTYQPKNLVLNLSLMSAVAYSSSDNKLTKYQYYKLNGTNPLVFYSRYLFVSPLEGISKLQEKHSDGYLLKAYRVFLPETGAYDKSTRDVEGIRELEDYVSREAYQIFRDYPKRTYQIPALAESMAAVARIRDLCAEKGTRLIVTCQPTYVDNLAFFSREDQARFFDALAQVTDYWDFTLSSVSYEPRYFYDATHFRNAVGEMMLARMFDDDSIYVPEGFGRYVARGSTPGAPEAAPLPETDYTARVPILRYHHLVEAGEAGGATMTVGAFADQMAALHAAGYTPVDIWQMRDYVEQGAELPEKPILITFDDGYESNYSLAYPILKQYGFKATIFAIGVSIGKDTYKDTGKPIIPHFSLEQAEEMTDSGLITVASHGYDVHQAEGLDPDPIRQGALQREGETETEYVEYLTNDALHMQALLGEAGKFFSYPEDKHDLRCLVILHRAGVFATVSGNGSHTLLIRGLPQCLFDMPRQLVTEDMTGAELVALLEADCP